jgi:hypothetical protein
MTSSNAQSFSSTADASAGSPSPRQVELSEQHLDGLSEQPNKSLLFQEVAEQCVGYFSFCNNVIMFSSELTHRK